MLGKKVRMGISKRVDLSRTMILNDNKIDCIHWDDPNEIVDRLQLLKASRQAGYNSHNNESVHYRGSFTKLRSVGLILN